MSTASSILKNFALFIEGFGYSGNLDELQLPALKIKTEEYRAGGMDAPIDLDMGMEKLEASFTLSKFDTWAMSALGQNVKNVSMTARGALEDLDGTVHEVVVKMTGKCTASEPDAWKAGSLPKHKFTYSLIYYHYAVDGAPVHIIDIPSMVRIIGGVDQLAAQRSALQMGGSISATLRNIIGA
jgi:P2 family phage contractile tail tube protein